MQNADKNRKSPGIRATQHSPQVALAATGPLPQMPTSGDSQEKSAHAQAMANYQMYQSMVLQMQYPLGLYQKGHPVLIPVQGMRYPVPLQNVPAPPPAHSKKSSTITSASGKLPSTSSCEPGSPRTPPAAHSNKYPEPQVMAPPLSPNSAAKMYQKSREAYLALLQQHYTAQAAQLAGHKRKREQEEEESHKALKIPQYSPKPSSKSTSGQSSKSKTATVTSSTKPATVTSNHKMPSVITKPKSSIVTVNNKMATGASNHKVATDIPTPKTSTVAASNKMPMVFSTSTLSTVVSNPKVVAPSTNNIPVSTTTKPTTVISPPMASTSHQTTSTKLAPKPIDAKSLDVQKQHQKSLQEMIIKRRGGWQSHKSRPAIPKPRVKKKRGRPRKHPPKQPTSNGADQARKKPPTIADLLRQKSSSTPEHTIEQPSSVSSVSSSENVEDEDGLLHGELLQVRIARYNASQFGSTTTTTSTDDEGVVCIEPESADLYDDPTQYWDENSFDSDEFPVKEASNPPDSLACSKISSNNTTSENPRLTNLNKIKNKDLSICNKQDSSKAEKMASIQSQETGDKLISSVNENMVASKQDFYTDESSPGSTSVDRLMEAKTEVLPDMDSSNSINSVAKSTSVNLSCVESVEKSSDLEAGEVGSSRSTEVLVTKDSISQEHHSNISPAEITVTAGKTCNSSVAKCTENEGLDKQESSDPYINDQTNRDKLTSSPVDAKSNKKSMQSSDETFELLTIDSNSASFAASALLLPGDVTTNMLSKVDINKQTIDDRSKLDLSKVNCLVSEQHEGDVNVTTDVTNVEGNNQTEVTRLGKKPKIVKQDETLKRGRLGHSKRLVISTKASGGKSEKLRISTRVVQNAYDHDMSKSERKLRKAIKHSHYKTRTHEKNAISLATISNQLRSLAASVAEYHLKMARKDKHNQSRHPLDRRCKTTDDTTIPADIQKQLLKESDDSIQNDSSKPGYRIFKSKSRGDTVAAKAQSKLSYILPASNNKTKRKQKDKQSLKNKKSAFIDAALKKSFYPRKLEVPDSKMAKVPDQTIKNQNPDTMKRKRTPSGIVEKLFKRFVNFEKNDTDNEPGSALTGEDPVNIPSVHEAQSMANNSSMNVSKPCVDGDSNDLINQKSTNGNSSGETITGPLGSDNIRSPDMTCNKSSRPTIQENSSPMARPVKIDSNESYVQDVVDSVARLVGNIPENKSQLPEIVIGTAQVLGNTQNVSESDKITRGSTSDASESIDKSVNQNLKHLPPDTVAETIENLLKGSDPTDNQDISSRSSSTLHFQVKSGHNVRPSPSDSLGETIRKVLERLDTQEANELGFAAAMNSSEAFAEIGKFALDIPPLSREILSADTDSLLKFCNFLTDDHEKDLLKSTYSKEQKVKQSIPSLVNRTPVSPNNSCSSPEQPGRPASTFKAPYAKKPFRRSMGKRLSKLDPSLGKGKGKGKKKVIKSPDEGGDDDDSDVPTKKVLRSAVSKYPIRSKNKVLETKTSLKKFANSAKRMPVKRKLRERPGSSPARSPREAKANCALINNMVYNESETDCYPSETDSEGAISRSAANTTPRRKSANKQYTIRGKAVNNEDIESTLTPAVINSKLTSSEFDLEASDTDSLVAGSVTSLKDAGLICKLKDGDMGTTAAAPRKPFPSADNTVRCSVKPSRKRAVHTNRELKALANRHCSKPLTARTQKNQSIKYKDIMHRNEGKMANRNIKMDTSRNNKNNRAKFVKKYAFRKAGTSNSALLSNQRVDRLLKRMTNDNKSRSKQMAKSSRNRTLVTCKIDNGDSNTDISDTESEGGSIDLQPSVNNDNQHISKYGMRQSTVNNSKTTPLADIRRCMKQNSTFKHVTASHESNIGDVEDTVISDKSSMASLEKVISDVIKRKSQTKLSDLEDSSIHTTNSNGPSRKWDRRLSMSEKSGSDMEDDPEISFKKDESLAAKCKSSKLKSLGKSKLKRQPGINHFKSISGKTVWKKLTKTVKTDDLSDVNNKKYPVRPKVKGLSGSNSVNAPVKRKFFRQQSTTSKTLQSNVTDCSNNVEQKTSDSQDESSVNTDRLPKVAKRARIKLTRVDKRNISKSSRIDTADRSKSPEVVRKKKFKSINSIKKSAIKNEHLVSEQSVKKSDTNMTVDSPTIKSVKKGRPKRLNENANDKNAAKSQSTTVHSNSNGFTDSDTDCDDVHIKQVRTKGSVKDNSHLVEAAPSDNTGNNESKNWSFRRRRGDVLYSDVYRSVQIRANYLS